MPQPLDRRRERFAQICLALPKVTRRGGQHDKFSVGNRTVAYYLDDHHGDGRRAVCCKAPPGMHTFLVDSYPDRYFIPSYLGPKGWVGLWMDLRSVDWDEVAQLVMDSYLLVAPKRLVALVSEKRGARR